MQLKYIFIILVLGLSFYIAFYIKKRGEQKILLNEAICDFIEYIKNQIEFFCTPTDEIIANYESPVLERYEFLTLIDENDWEKALYESKASVLLDKRTTVILDAFSKKLGKSSAQEQISNCDYTLRELRKELEIQKNEVPKKSKAFSAITVVFGFMAVIIIL